MPLINNLIYEPEIKEIKEEGDIIGLLNDVGTNLHMVGLSVSETKLKDVLKIVEKGEYVSPFGNPFINSVDLSKAKNIVTQYRMLSEGGCRPCKHLYGFMPLQDETLKYCDVSETEEIALEKIDTRFTSLSPRLTEFYEKGCKERKPVFTKTIEEILEKHISDEYNKVINKLKKGC